jgi:hypothetical protein
MYNKCYYDQRQTPGIAVASETLALWSSVPLLFLIRIKSEVEWNRC